MVGVEPVGAVAVEPVGLVELVAVEPVGVELVGLVPLRPPWSASSRSA